MQKVHCDMEECSSSEAFDLEAATMLGIGAAPLSPKGWGVLQWTTDGVGEHNHNSKIMARYFRALGESLPKRAAGRDPGEVLGKVADEIGAPPPVLMTLRAYLCPTCMGKLALAQFNVINRQALAAPLFG